MRKSALWLGLLAAVLAGFFHESLFRGHSLVPTDLLHNLMLPFGADVARVRVQNHYAMDALTTDYPLGKLWRQSVLRDGELPLWNPYILGGHPNLADSMPAVLSPFKALYLCLTPERAFTLGIVLQLWLAGWFMFLFLRRIGRSGAASFVGACAWMLNSPYPPRPGVPVGCGWLALRRPTSPQRNLLPDRRLGLDGRRHLREQILRDAPYRPPGPRGDEIHPSLLGLHRLFAHARRGDDGQVPRALAHHRLDRRPQPAVCQTQDPRLAPATAAR